MFHKGASEQENLYTDLSGPWNQCPVGGSLFYPKTSRYPYFSCILCNILVFWLAEIPNIWAVCHQ